MSTITKWLLLLLPISLVSSQCQNVFCPISANDDTVWTSNDVGLNIWSSSSSRADDCILRHSTECLQTSIATEWINPSNDLLVVSHGWYQDQNHYITDKWTEVGGNCVSSANPGNPPIEECEPTDYNAQYWIQNGWNVIFLDWKYYSDESEVKDAERKLYVAVHNGKTVIDLLYDKLIDVLTMSNWDGNELRIVGHSLGAQVTLLLASKFITDTTNNYGSKVQRLGLLDHFFSNGEKQYLPQKDPNCVDWWWWPCAHQWVGEYARGAIMQSIRSNNNPPVIENYRTSATSSNPFIGDENQALNKMTVFSELTPWYYNTIDLAAKHKVALPIYLHCMKWISHGQLSDNAPSCRMDTSSLKNKCIITNWDDQCQKKYEQTDGKYTTWDYDDRFSENNV